MLIAEDLLLVLTDDDSGKLATSSAAVDVALGGAVLAELALAGRVDLTGPGEGRKGRLVVRDGPPPDDAVLADALDVVTARAGKKPESVVTALGKGLRARLYERMVERGILRPERARILGIFPARRWPAVDSGYERDLRARLEQALVVGLVPQPRVAELVSLLWGLRSVHKVVDRRRHGLSRRDLDRRAKEVAADRWPGLAVRKAVDAQSAAAAGG